MDRYIGCASGSCIFGPPEGQRTNGPCLCLISITRKILRVAIEERFRERDRAVTLLKKAHDAVIAEQFGYLTGDWEVEAAGFLKQPEREEVGE